jgi:hypothetical protein
MKNNMSQTPQHLDVLGNEIAMGTTVAVSHHGMQICTVVKVNPKMLRVQPVRPNYHGDGYLKYPSDMVAVDPQLVMLYVLKYNGANK